MGAKAEYITKDHEYAGSNFRPSTPLYKITEENGFIVGIGIHFGPVTFLHVIEDTVEDFPKKVYCSKEYIVKVFDRNGKEMYVKLKAHDPDISQTRIDKEEGKWKRKFFTDYLTKNGSLSTGYIGEARSWIIRARDLFCVQKELLKKGIKLYTTENENKSLFTEHE